MAASPPSDADLRARITDLCGRVAELRLQASRLRARSADSQSRADLDACIGELVSRCADLDDVSDELHAFAVELHDRTPAAREERANTRKMTPAQADAARHIMSSAAGVIRPIGPGRWGVERRRKKGEWSTKVAVVRAMETHGWLERSGQRAESWRDPRQLTDAGRAALATAEAAAKAAHTQAVLSRFA